MPKPAITPEIERFIRENAKTLSNQQVADKFGIAEGPVQRYRKKNNLVLPYEISREIAASKLRGKTILIGDQDQFIIENYLTVNVNQLSIALSVSETAIKGALKRLSLVIPQEIIEQRKKESRIKRGNVPINKGKKQVEYMTPEAIERTKATRFQKGGQPKNTLYNGKITIRNDHGRLTKWLRIDKGEWIELQKHNWLKAGNTIPPGMILSFIDGDSLNCEVWNLKLITLAENLQRNRNRKKAAERIIVSRRGSAEKLEIKKLQKAERTRKSREGVKLRRKLERQAEKEKLKAERLEQQRLERMRKENSLQHVRAAKERRRLEAEFEERRRLPNRVINYSEMIPVKVDAKTTIYIKAGQDPEVARTNFLNRHR